MRVTWSEGAVPPRFGYFVEGQSNAVGRPLGEFTTSYPTGWILHLSNGAKQIIH